MPPSVSLCLIARDEEAHLPACLASAAGLFDETVVVDTGSADRTRAGAAAGARVCDFPWADDFAAARNESLRHATGAWASWLDADERLDEDNRGKLRALLAGLADDNAAYVLPCRCLPDTPGQTATVVEHVRLFRNRPEHRWRYRVHEQVLPALRASGADLRWADVPLDHTGYTDPATQARKAQRNLCLLARQDAERPGHPYPPSSAAGPSWSRAGRPRRCRGCARACAARARAIAGRARHTTSARPRNAEAKAARGSGMLGTGPSDGTGKGRFSVRAGRPRRLESRPAIRTPSPGAPCRLEIDPPSRRDVGPRRSGNEREQEMHSRFIVSAVAALVGCLGGAARAGEPPFYPDKTNLLVYRDGEGKEHSVRTAANWARRRAHVLANLQLVMGPLPDDSRKVPLDVRVTEEVKTDKLVRRKLTFAAEKGDRVPAYLFLPAGAEGRLPAVLCLHPTSREFGKGVAAGLGGKADRHYAVHLAERGYVTLAPDYPDMGEYRFDAYKNGYASTTMKAVWNHVRAVDLLQALPEVDPERLGVLGHSLGGHNSLFVAAFDPRIKCVVSNCGV